VSIGVGARRLHAHSVKRTAVMQIVPRLAPLGRVELIMTRPADGVATDDNFRNYPKSKRRNKMIRRSVCVPLETNVDPFVRPAEWDQATNSGTSANVRFLEANPALSAAVLAGRDRRVASGCQCVLSTPQAAWRERQLSVRPVTELSPALTQAVMRRTPARPTEI
jgi:hypothetical protein